MRTLKHRQNLGVRCKMPPLRVGPRHVAEQFAVFAGGWVQEKGQVGDEGNTVGDRDQHAKGIVINQRRKTFGICFFEWGRDVHG